MYAADLSMLVFVLTGRWLSARNLDGPGSYSVRSLNPHFEHRSTQRPYSGGNEPNRNIMNLSLC
jgi:hypothetical protein